MASHQTIRLLRGRHSSPAHGACVMEVASMLAGEMFSDEPVCVDPVIAEFLRTYNDDVDDRRRQDLYPYAAIVVGSREGPSPERRRANLLADWWLRGKFPGLGRVFRILWRLVPSSAMRDIEIAHRAGRWGAAHPERHAEVLGLIERMTGQRPVEAGDAGSGPREPIADAGRGPIADAEPRATDAAERREPVATS